ncbi:hypothetical protein D3C75_1270390 [compost metagenome]
MFPGQLGKVLPISGLAEIMGALKQLFAIDPLIEISDFFKAGNFQALAMFDGLHIL